MTNFAHGRAAEAAAANYLIGRGYKIIDQNWRRRACEIDLVACKDDCVFLVEVKYREHSSQGTGLEYITQKKLKQMMFAANMWVSENEWIGDYCLSAIEVSGDFEVTEFIDSVT